jgi:hypothetical protein
MARRRLVCRNACHAHLPLCTHRQRSPSKDTDRGAHGRAWRKRFGYDSTLVLGAVTEISISEHPDDVELAETLQRFQKLFKYGLPSFTAVPHYELGFAERVIAQRLAVVIGERATREEAQQALSEHRAALGEILDDLPSNYSDLFERLAPREIT